MHHSLHASTITFSLQNVNTSESEWADMHLVAIFRPDTAISFKMILNKPKTFIFSTTQCNVTGQGAALANHIPGRSDKRRSQKEEICLP